MTLQITLLSSFLLAAVSILPAQGVAKSGDQESNIQSYVDLIRADVKAEKVQILAAMMQFTPEEAATFWPIYNGYDANLTKLGDQRLALIKEYSDAFDSMSDAKADELVQKNFALVTERNALLKKCYEDVKSKMDAKTAARFLQVEYQLVTIIDLQISSRLPVVE
jgi:hypothetical protein